MSGKSVAGADHGGADQPNEALRTIVAEVLRGPRYQGIDPTIVLTLARREASKGRSTRDTVKAIKTALHQIAGAYLTQGSERDLPYADWLTELAQNTDRTATCREIMRHHASTRERLPHLDAVMRVLRDALPTGARPLAIADLACGLNPLAAPLLGLPTEATYYACDLYSGMTDFLRAALPLLEIRAVVEMRDLTHAIAPPPTPAASAVTGASTGKAGDTQRLTLSSHFDLVLLLKVIPCLDQIDRTAAPRLLAELDADTVVLSFPRRALSGRDVGMDATYAARAATLLTSPWRISARHDFPTETLWIAIKG